MSPEIGRAIKTEKEKGEAMKTETQKRQIKRERKLTYWQTIKREEPTVNVLAHEIVFYHMPFSKTNFKIISFCFKLSIHSNSGKITTPSKLKWLGIKAVCTSETVLFSN